MIIESALALILHVNEDLEKKIYEISMQEKNRKYEQIEVNQMDAEIEFLFKKLFEELERSNRSFQLK